MIGSYHEAAGPVMLSIRVLLLIWTLEERVSCGGPVCRQVGGHMDSGQCGCWGAGGEGAPGCTDRAGDAREIQ